MVLKVLPNMITHAVQPIAYTEIAGDKVTLRISFRRRRNDFAGPLLHQLACGHLAVHLLVASLGQGRHKLR